jgi:hypothetical protein
MSLRQLNIQEGRASNGGGLCLKNAEKHEISARLRGVTIAENFASKSGGGVWHEGLVLALSGTKGADSKLPTQIG